MLSACSRYVTGIVDIFNICALLWPLPNESPGYAPALYSRRSVKH